MVAVRETAVGLTGDTQPTAGLPSSEQRNVEPGSSAARVNVAARAVLTAVGRSVIPVLGGTVSTGGAARPRSRSTSPGVGSWVPPASTLRTENVWFPFASPV